jgi:hypothetical protein
VPHSASGIRRFLAAAIVAICIVVPLVESLDTWDNTLSGGNDTEANVVIAALCVGLALSAAANIGVLRPRALPVDPRFPARPSELITLRCLIARPLPFATAPPLALRI